MSSNSSSVTISAAKKRRMREAMRFKAEEKYLADLLTGTKSKPVKSTTKSVVKRSASPSPTSTSVTPAKVPERKEVKVKVKVKTKAESKSQVKIVDELEEGEVSNDDCEDDSEVDDETTESGDDGESKQERTERARREWAPITSDYGLWAEDFMRLRYIFDLPGKYTKVYDKYGYDSKVPELNHQQVRYHNRLHIYKAKRCYKLREEFLDVLSKTIEVKNAKFLVEVTAARTYPGEPKRAKELGDALLQETLSFLLYKAVVNPVMPRTGGFSFFNTATGETVFAWRENSKLVSLELEYVDGTFTMDKRIVFQALNKLSTGDVKSGQLMTELFYARTVQQVLFTMQKFIDAGWVVIPSSVAWTVQCTQEEPSAIEPSKSVESIVQDSSVESNQPAKFSNTFVSTFGDPSAPCRFSGSFSSDYSVAVPTRNLSKLDTSKFKAYVPSSEL